MDPLTITSEYPLLEVLLPILATLSSTGLEIFVPKWQMFLPRDTTMVPP